MTNQSEKQKLIDALASGDKKTAMKIMEPLFDYAYKMLIGGVLSKNVIQGFVNRGISVESATNIVEVAMVRAENFGHKGIA